MSETLSQEEVDALRQAVSDGTVLEETEPEAKEKRKDHVKVVAYDFRKPHFISADQRSSMETVHDTMAQGIQAGLNATLRKGVEVKLVSMDQISYGEFELSLARPACLALLQTDPDYGPVALETGVSLTAAMIEIMLGGDGSGSEEVKSLTSLDMEMISPVMDSICAQMGDAWSGITPISFRSVRSETHPEYLQLTRPETACMNVVLDMHAGSASGIVNICYPFAFLQRVFASMESRLGRKSDDKERDKILKALSPVPVDLRVALGSSTLSARQISRLKPGDVVCLGREYDEPVDVYVDRNLFFTAQAGKRRGKLVVRLGERAVQEEKH